MGFSARPLLAEFECDADTRSQWREHSNGVVWENKESVAEIEWRPVSYSSPILRWQVTEPELPV